MKLGKLFLLTGAFLVMTNIANAKLPGYTDGAELKTIRKKNAIMVFATQSPSDVLNNPIARTVVEQTSTQIMLPNEKADEEEYVKFFKATPEEYNIVVNLPVKSRFFLVKQLNSSSLVRLDLSNFSDEMTVFSSTTVNIEIMHEVREELKRNGVEDKPENWLPVFYEAVRANKQQKKRTLSTKRSSLGKLKEKGYGTRKHRQTSRSACGSGIRLRGRVLRLLPL